jgi:hypothetical protein
MSLIGGGGGEDPIAQPPARGSARCRRVAVAVKSAERNQPAGRCGGEIHGKKAAETRADIKAE